MADMTSSRTRTERRIEAGLRRALDPVVALDTVPAPRYARIDMGRSRRRRLALSLAAAAALTLSTALVAAAAEATGSTDPGAWGRHLSNSVQACRDTITGGIGGCVQAVIAADPQGRGIGLTTHSAHAGPSAWPGGGDRPGDAQGPGTGLGRGGAPGQSGEGQGAQGGVNGDAHANDRSRNHPGAATPEACSTNAADRAAPGAGPCPKS